VNAEQYALLAGTLVPLVVMLINRFWTLSSVWRAWAAGIGSLLLGIGTVYYAGGMKPDAIVTTILAVYGAGQAAYRLIFKPLGWTASAWDEAAAKASAKK
jgi:uncharacterized membrane protein